MGSNSEGQGGQGSSRSATSSARVAGAPGLALHDGSERGPGGACRKPAARASRPSVRGADGKKVDIIVWSSDPLAIRNALSPAQVVKVEPIAGPGVRPRPTWARRIRGHRRRKREREAGRPRSGGRSSTPAGGRMPTLQDIFHGSRRRTSDRDAVLTRASPATEAPKGGPDYPHARWKGGAGRLSRASLRTWV